jgi:tetratricopeptide (TPR) repeat protein
MGDIFRCRGEFDNALDCFTSSLRIVEQLCDMQEIIDAQMQISLVYLLKGDLDEALNYTTLCLEISKEIENEWGVGLTMHVVSLIYWRKGDLDIALENGLRSLEILEKMPIFEWTLCFPLFGMGLYKFENGDYDTAIEYLEKSLSIQKDTGNWQIMLWTTTTLFLSYKLLGRKYDETEIHTLIKEAEYIEEYCHYSLFLLLEDISYLETAYNQVQELADNLEPEVAAKFLSYPIPKAIVEEWKKVK